MSISVEVDALPDAIARQSSVAYLLTLSDGERVHAMAVQPTMRGGVVVCSAGNTARANVAARSSVTLLWPPTDPSGHTLLVDGRASVEGHDVVVHPTSAVLHVTR